MARDPKRSRMLRRLASTLMSQVPKVLLTSSRADLTTSLVRQWQSYENHATLILGAEQHFFRPATEHKGELRFDLHKESVQGWFDYCRRQCDFSFQELKKALPQLNLSQSTELTNRQGLLLRMWVNPKERSKGIQHLDALPPSPTVRPEDYFVKLAKNHVEKYFFKRAESEKAELSDALVRQWAQNDGHALLVTPKGKFHIIMSLDPEGTRISTEPLGTSLPEKLLKCGLTEEEIPHFISRINRGDNPELIDEQGRRCQVKIDPKNAHLYFDEIAQAPPNDLMGYQFDVGM